MINAASSTAIMDKSHNVILTTKNKRQ